MVRFGKSLNSLYRVTRNWWIILGKHLCVYCIFQDDILTWKWPYQSCHRLVGTSTVPFTYMVRFSKSLNSLYRVTRNWWIILGKHLCVYCIFLVLYSVSWKFAAWVWYTGWRALDRVQSPVGHHFPRVCGRMSLDQFLLAGYVVWDMCSAIIEHCQLLQTLHSAALLVDLGWLCPMQPKSPASQTTAWFLSKALVKSLYTLRKAVSVLWAALYADWYSSRNPFVVRCPNSLSSGVECPCLTIIRKDKWYFWEGLVIFFTSCPTGQVAI